MLTSFHSIDAYILKFTQFLATAYIKLPPFIIISHAILNVKNADNRCFIYSVLAALHPIKHGEHANRVSRYKPFEHELDTSGLSFQVSLSDVRVFEQRNKLAINVFGYNSKLYPLQLSSSSGIIINLLFLSDKSGNSHYTLIKNLVKLMYKENKHHGNKYFCNHSLMRFQIQDRRDAHQRNCQTSNQETETPDDTTMSFHNHKHGLPHVSTLILNVFLFQCLTATYPTFYHSQRKFRSIYLIHRLFFHSSIAASIPLQQYRGGEAVCRFLRAVLEHAEQHQCEYDHKQSMHMSFEDGQRGVQECDNLLHL